MKKKSKTEATTPYIFNLLPQNKNFTGREGLLTQIAQTLARSSVKEVHPVILTACHGLGGVGKTQLALEYTYRHLHAYTAIYWINAETTEQIELVFYQLGQVLKLEAQSSPAVIAMVKHWWETHPGYLVIFDNVEDYAKIEPYLPRVNGHVLITSRYTQWPHHGIAVDVFGSEEANAYIKKILPMATPPEVEQLAQMLGYLPLALAQACAFIKQNHIMITKYLEWYITKRATLLQSNHLPPGDKHIPVYVNWEMTLKVIREKLKHEKGEKLLTFCAYLQHTGIPKQLLLNYLVDQQLTDELEQIQLLALLINYSLLHEDKNPDCYILHPVMQEVLKLAHNETAKATQLQAVICQLNKLYPYGKDKLDDLQLKRQLLPHLERVLKQLTQNSLIQEEDILLLLIRLADGFDVIGGAKQSKVYLEQALAIQEKHYGPDHPKVACTLANLGNAYGDLGDAKQQKTYLEKALAIEEKHYGPDHLEVAGTLVNLGNAYGALGDAKQQKTYLERALVIKEKHYGLDHPTVAITLGNLGNACGALGDTKQAKTYLERTLAIDEKYYGPDHPTVAIILTNLGNVCGALGDAKQAKVYLKRALVIKEKYYELDHSEVAITLVNLGNAYGDLGDTQQKKAYLEQALGIFEKHYGKNHPNIAITLTNLGNACGALGDAKQQKTHLEKALEILEEHYGPDHPEVANTLTNLGNACGALGDAKQKKAYLERALAIQEKHYGLNHLVVAITLGNLGNAYGDLGDTQQKKTYIERALVVLEEHYGKDHPEVAITLVNLGNAHFTLHNIEQAVALVTQAYVIFQKHYGDNHRYTQLAKFSFVRYQSELVNYSPTFNS